MIRTFISELLAGRISRRRFVSSLGGIGVSPLAAARLAESLAAHQAGAPAHSLRDVTGGDITVATLQAWGVKYVFGNTGGYEVGFLDALVDAPDVRYVLGLHEGSVMAMADGHAR